MRGSSAFISASLWLSFMPSFSAPPKSAAFTSRSIWIATRFGPGAAIASAAEAFFSGRYSPMT